MALNDTLKIDNTITNYSKTSVSSLPTSAFPLDSRSYFSTLADAEEVAKTAKPQGSNESIYYVGLLIFILETNSYYIIGNPIDGEANLLPILSLDSIKAGNNITLDKQNNTITINSTATGGGGSIVQGIQTVEAKPDSGIVSTTDNYNVTLDLDSEETLFVLDGGTASDVYQDNILVYYPSASEGTVTASEVEGLDEYIKDVTYTKDEIEDLIQDNAGTPEIIYGGTVDE